MLNVCSGTWYVECIGNRIGWEEDNRIKKKFTRKLVYDGVMGDSYK